MSKRPTESNYHIPVLLNEALDALRIRGDGIYVDMTFGGGGHAKPILNRITAKGRLFGFDQDIKAIENAVDDERFVFVHSNFKYLKHFMLFYGIDLLDGIIADLGVSSHHFDEPSRGFSHRFDSPLDMRMNQAQAITARDVMNGYEERQLQNILSAFGEVRNAKSLANRIVLQRSKRPIVTAGDLIDVVEPMIRGDYQKYLSQVFQAVRIEVNDEMNALREMLTQGAELLGPGGRFVVLTYHSVEDRQVKNFFKRGNVEGRLVKDDYGNVEKVLEEVNKRPFVASEEERKRNRRSISAKLRIAQKPG